MTLRLYGSGAWVVVCLLSARASFIVLYDRCHTVLEVFVFGLDASGC